MPLQKLQFRPGLNREGTTLANEGGWYDGDKIRFRSGYPEKIGGWSALSYSTFLGVCRSLWNWVTLRGYNLMGVGTNLKFYVEYGGAYNDITPLYETNTNPSNQITLRVTAASTTLSITDINADALQTGNFVTLAGATSLGGLTGAQINGEYQIASITGVNSYTVTLSTTAGSTASSSTMTGLTIAYQIPIGNSVATSGTGWGAGPWPPYLTTTLTNPFTASGTGVSVLNVNQPSHGLATNDWVSFTSIASNPCGINKAVLQKAFKITKVDANNYTISTVIGQAPGPVLTYTTTSTAASGGSVTVAYPDVANVASYNRGWGVGYVVGIEQQLRLWSQSNFGERLLFSPRGGALYTWTPTSATAPDFTTRGSLVSGTDVPAAMNQILVADQTRIVIAFGCSDYGAYPQVQDPMLVRWTAQESYTNWTPSISNSAGSYRLSHGSKIICALHTRQEILVWTDTALYSMQFVGPPYIWSFTLLADNVSIVSPNAMTTAAGVVYWMGTDKFYAYSGRVETLPCSVRTYVYDRFNRDQQFEVIAGTNEGFSEVWWFYPSNEDDNDDIDSYVIFNYLDRVWYYGNMARTAWLDTGYRDYPIAATLGNILVEHEAAIDDGTTNPPSPIPCYVQSSDFDIGDGHNYGFVWRVIPDVTFDGSLNPTPADPNNTDNYPSVQFTLRPRINPGSGYTANNSPTVRSVNSYVNQNIYNVQQFTEIVYTRARGRQMALRVESDQLGTQWQLGVPRLDVRPDGRR